MQKLQEEYLKLFYLPKYMDFGMDLPEHYGFLTYYDETGEYHEEKILSVLGDYERIYHGLYEPIAGHGKRLVKDEETLL